MMVWSPAPLSANSVISACLESVELVEANPLLAKAGAELESAQCGAWGSAAEPRVGTSIEIEDNEADEVPDDDLDEVGSGVYLCRWPNGDFSVVKADSRREAILGLDEWDGAHPDWLTPLETCMIDFQINDKGEFELVQFGHDTADFVRKSGAEQMEAQTEIGRTLQRMLGTVGPVADHYVEQAASQILRSKSRSKGKPN